MTHLRGRCDYHSHFTGKETEAQKWWATCPRPHGCITTGSDSSLCPSPIPSTPLLVNCLSSTRSLPTPVMSHAEQARPPGAHTQTRVCGLLGLGRLGAGTGGGGHKKFLKTHLQSEEMLGRGRSRLRGLLGQRQRGWQAPTILIILYTLLMT